MWVDFTTKNVLLDLDEREGFCFLSLINRDGKWVTNGVIQGFGNVEGLACSFNTAAEILAIGRKPEAMSAAVNRVLDMKGGIVAIEGGRVAHEFPLALGGLMSDLPIKQLPAKIWNSGNSSLQENTLIMTRFIHSFFYPMIFSLMQGLITGVWWISGTMRCFGREGI